jgi:hypothetical protein
MCDRPRSLSPEVGQAVSPASRLKASGFFVPVRLNASRLRREYVSLVCKVTLTVSPLCFDSLIFTTYFSLAIDHTPKLLSKSTEGTHFPVKQQFHFETAPKTTIQRTVNTVARPGT